jgi:hypothetical protein
MKLTLIKSSVAALFLCTALAQSPAAKAPAHSAASEVSYSSTIETIEFKDVPKSERRAILDRIGVRIGDQLSVDARHRIGRELRSIQKGMTFMYRSGTKLGTAKLIITGDC